MVDTDMLYMAAQSNKIASLESETRTLRRKIVRMDGDAEGRCEK